MKLKKLKKILNQKKLNIMFYSGLTILLITVVLCRDVEYLIFSLILVTFCVFLKVVQLVRFKQILWNIDSKELDKIEKEMCDAMWGSQGQYALTDSYIIKTGFNAAIIRISDIILTYKKNVFMRRSIDTQLVIVTKDNKKCKIIVDNFVRGFYGNDSKLDEVLRYRNLNILFGYSKKNIKTIKDKYGFIVFW